MALPRPVRRLALVLALGCGAWTAWWAATEAGPDAPRWLEKLPAYAAEQGYGEYRWWERGRALRRWTPPRPSADGPLLVDTWHSRKQPADSVLVPGEYRYDRMHGLGRAFWPVRRAVRVVNVGIDFALDAPGTLDGASALFINLPSGDQAGFRWSEVRAIDAFVRAGGGLLLVTDHSNCYAHADMLAQLAAVLGFSLPPVTAVDPDHGLGPRAKTWFRTRQVLAHPVTEGVGLLGFVTAGAVEGLRPLVGTSRQGWADHFEPERKADSAGFTGNLERDADEPLGPVPVVAAGEVGAGRVVVIADQNALGATMIGFGDNQRLFTNAMSWVTGRDIQPLAPEVVTVGPGCADKGDDGYRSLQVEVARRARDACEGPQAGAAWIALPGAAVPESGRGIVVSDDVTEPRTEGDRYWLPANLARNRALGDERDDPRRRADGSEAPNAASHRAVTAALEWLIGPPSP